MTESIDYRYAVVHYGSRDRYQVALALHEAHALEKLFTDFYTPDLWMKALKATWPSMASRFQARQEPAISSKFTDSLILRAWPLQTWLGWRGYSKERMFMVLDDMLSKHAAQAVSKAVGVGAVCYSYYWKALGEARARGTWKGPGIVFQVHPVAQQIKRILREDREKCGLRYSPEREEIETEENDAHYIDLVKRADGVIATSQFTARGLQEAGVPQEAIAVVPYGAELDSSDWADLSAPREASRRPGKLRLLWVGQLAYRKGAHHLFEALQSFSPEQVSLTMVTQSAVPAELGPLMPEHVQILNNVTDAELVQLYRNHDLFVLPAMVEGFGLVYLEALAQGLPILCTWNTGGADIIEDGCEGFIVPPGESTPIVEAIERCLVNPSLLQGMAQNAGLSIRTRNWAAFREGFRRAVRWFEERRVQIDLSMKRITAWDNGDTP